MIACRQMALASLVVPVACSRQGPVGDDLGSDGGNAGILDGGAGGRGAGGSIAATGGDAAVSLLPPKYHPPAGFEDCKHAEVRANCNDGWCRLPPSCFVMGSPEDEWYRGRENERQIAVTLTHAFEMQQTEMTRGLWLDLVKIDTEANTEHICGDSTCPITNMTWWDAIHAANLLSMRNGHSPCYEPLGCEGTPGNGLVCASVARPDAAIQECTGYRLPTRAEAEYAARAGTITAFYSGGISEQADIDCRRDDQLEAIAWYCDNSGTRSHNTGQRQPNDFGLHDLIGNVGEMLNDQHTFTSSPGAANPEGTTGSQSTRSVYGCDVRSPSAACRAAVRLSWSWDTKSWFTGFRLVRTIPDGE